MSTAYEDSIPAEDEFVPQEDERHLRPVKDGESEPSDGKETVILVAGGGVAKSTPDNVRWLRARLGAGPLSWVFLRAGRAVRVTCLGEDGYIEPIHDDEENGPATVAPLHGRELSTRMSDHYDFLVERVSKAGKTFRTEEWFPVTDADRVLELIDRLPHLRPLRGVTHTPLPRAEGGLIVTPGYDDQSGFLYQPQGDVPAVPERPTAGQISEATSFLRSLVADFEFVGKHGEANYLGAMLTPLMRLVTPPPYKMLCIGAHQRGSGKSLLAEVLRNVHGGTLRTWPGSEEELGKQITAVLSATTAPVCQIDNVRGIVRSAKLDALLTTREYTDRVLGSSNDTTMINDRLWVATGNNMVLGGDLDRRTVWVTIDPGVESPEDRTDFAIKALGRYALEHRGRILHALLTLLAGWDAAGRPTREPTADSFGIWVAAVRGVLDLAGISGEFDHRDSRPDSFDPDSEDAAQFLGAVREHFADGVWTVRDITTAMDAKAAFEPTPQAARLLDSFPASAKGKHWRPGGRAGELARPLGYWLRHREGQWFGGLSAERVGKGKLGASFRVVTSR